jgi:Family of unknown function (DUF6077)
VRALAARRLGVALDFVSDWVILCFASWTLLAYLGMITEARVSLLTPIWLVTTPFLAAFLFRLRVGRAGSSGAAVSSAPRRSGKAGRRTLVLVGLAAGLVAAPLAARPGNVPWAIVWLPAFVAAGAAVAAGKLRSEAPVIVEEKAGWPADVFAAVVGVAFGAMSLFVDRSNADDVFYVNRATATRQLDHIPVLDVIFTHEEVARAGGAGLPLDSYSALQGALARLVGVQAPSVAYYIFPPFFTFLATWALWRLVRAWAPRHAWLCLALGSVFWVWSAQYPLTSGNYFLNRMWQGKVVFVAWVVPTLFVYLTRWLGKREALTAVLLLAAGLCSIGMSGSATFVAPLVFLAAVVPLVARMEWPSLTIPLAAAAIPFGIGMFVLLRFPLSETIGREPLFAQSWYYQQVVGSGVVGAVAALGVWAAPWIARAGPAERVATGLAVVFAGLTVPGMIAFLSDVSGLTGTLRRILWVVPFPALVGLLAAVPVAKGIGRLIALAGALAVSILLVAFGTPLWTSWVTGRALWQYPPAWHVRKGGIAQAILRNYDGNGPVLAERDIMTAIAILTVEPKAVNARGLYLVRTRLPPGQIHERIVLTRFITQPARPRSTPAVRRALADLGVGLVCVPESRPEFIPVVQSIGPFREAFTAGGQMCLQRTTAPRS